ASAEKKTRRAIAAGWDEAETQQQLAEAYLRQGKFKELLDEVRVKDQYPKETQADLLGLRAAAYTSLGKWDDAVEEIAAGEKVSAQALWVLQSKARLAVHNDDRPALKTIVAKALTVYPENKDLLLMAAAIAAYDNDVENASLALQKIIDLEPARLMTVWGRQARLTLFRIRFKQQDFASAKTLVDAVLKVFKNDPEANYLGALLAYSQQQYDLAEERLNTVLLTMPEHREAILLLGRLNYMQKDYQQAAHYLEQATSAQPENKPAQALLGKTYMMLGQYDEAERKLLSITSQSANDAELLALAGIVKMKSGDASSGIEELKKALDLNTADKRIRSELVNAYLVSGNTSEAIKLLEDAIDSSDEDQHFKSMLLLSYARAGEFDKAHALADELIAQYPDKVIGYSLKAVVYESQGDVKAAAENYNKVLSIEKDNVLSLFGLAHIDQVQGNDDKAENHYQQILEKHPENASALVALAELQAKKGQNKEALATLNKARETNLQALEARLILSNFYLAQGETEKALQIANEALNIASNSPGAILAVARAKMVTDKKEALRLLDNLVKYSPNFAEAYFYLAQARALSGDTAGTRQALEKAIELKPDYLKARLSMAEIDLKAGKVDAVLEVVGKVLEQYPENAETYILWGDALLQKKNVQSAMASYEKAVKYSNKSAAIIRVSQLYQIQGKTDEGIAALQQWLQQHDDDFSARLILANLLLTKGDNEVAHKEYTHLNEKFAENAVVLNDLAWLKFLKGDKDALSLAERAHRLAPDSPAIQDTYGWVLLKSGRAESALIVLQKAVDNLPDNPDIRYHYAAVLAQTGNKEKAKTELDAILKTDKPFSEKAGALQLREQL
ncbi:MAG: PEP-CTERM system TPR-repeat protein PrsT, partial [Gammaproteobacteria bacterium]|nr:PEP-CTERM system TPR-repeat protein PrsT [Gammaproteobacteria bacterium]